jgi:two-component sensor histidine kinase
MDEDRSGTSVGARDVEDFWPRVLVSPILGALVVNLSGLVDHARHSVAALVASYGWFSLVAFLVWEGNRRLYFRLQRREDWLLRPWRRLGLLVAVICLYTIPVAAALLCIWREAAGDRGTRPDALPTALFAIVALVVAIAHVYETVFLLRDWESDRLRGARLEQSRLQTELESLGREVDPHFLFNNLNALAHLVDQRDDRSDAAATFIRNLSATYRYVLESRGRTLVPLADELEALERHRALAEIRYGGSVQLQVDVDAADAQDLLLPPVSLAELFQNALKHNTVGLDTPLRIRVRVEGTTLVFENDLRPGSKPLRSTGVGLVNVRERFRMATGRAAAWASDGTCFVVRLPLVRNLDLDNGAGLCDSLTARDSRSAN